MSIEYERTFTIEYNDCKITDAQKNILAEKLQANGVIAHSYTNDEYENLEYGEYEKTETTKSYQIIDEDNNVVYENPWLHNTADVFHQISKHIGGLSRQEQKTETTSKEMRKINS